MAFELLSLALCIDNFLIASVRIPHINLYTALFYKSRVRYSKWLCRLFQSCLVLMQQVSSVEHCRSTKVAVTLS